MLGAAAGQAPGPAAPSSLSHQTHEVNDTFFFFFFELLSGDGHFGSQFTEVHHDISSGLQALLWQLLHYSGTGSPVHFCFSLSSFFCWFVFVLINISGLAFHPLFAKWIDVI